MSMEARLTDPEERVESNWQLWVELPVLRRSLVLDLGAFLVGSESALL